jgi:hypothetical protein
MSAGADRRFLAVIVGTAVAAVAIIAPGGAAAFDHQFTVLSKDRGGHRTANGFAFNIELLNPSNNRNKVGRGHGRCRVKGHRRKARCRLVVHLDGSVGGFGDLVLKGNVGRGDRTMDVVGGHGDFGGGVAGRARIDSVNDELDRMRFDLTG